jgi:hypothetical protein
MKTAHTAADARGRHAGGRKFGLFTFINGLFFIVFCLFILVPLWKVLVDSLDLTTGYGMKLFPEKFGFAGYTSVFTNRSLYIPLINSVITTVSGTLIGLLLSTLGAYVLIQEDMPGRGPARLYPVVYVVLPGRHDPHVHRASQAGADQPPVVGHPAPPSNVLQPRADAQLFRGASPKPVRVRNDGRLHPHADAFLRIVLPLPRRRWRPSG